MKIWDFARRASPDDPKKAVRERKKKKQTENRDKFMQELGDSLQQVSPMTVMNEQVKNRIKTVAKSNARQITLLLVEAGCYCSVFHETKRALKHVTKDRKYSGPAVKYVSNVAMPTGLYGPIFGFLIRLALPF